MKTAAVLGITFAVTLASGSSAPMATWINPYRDIANYCTRTVSTLGDPWCPPQPYRYGRVRYL